MVCTLLRTIPLSALLLAGCGNAEPTDGNGDSSKQATPHPYGYADIRLGSTLEYTLSKVGRDFYRPQDVAECLMNMPQKGCTLIWNNLAIPYVRKNGVPYRLHLTFDKWANLQSLSLSYDSLRQDISLDECRDLHNRTAEWLRKDYQGITENKGHVSNGNEIFPILKGEFGTKSGKSVSVFTVDSYISGSCDVNVSFSTADEDIENSK